jgi:hypothetical protein
VYGHAVNFYSGGIRFESRPRYKASLLRLLSLFLSFHAILHRTITQVTSASFKIPAYSPFIVILLSQSTTLYNLCSWEASLSNLILNHHRSVSQSVSPVKSHHISYSPSTPKIKLFLCFNWAPRHEGVLGSKGIAPHILDLDTRRRWVVNFTIRPLYPQG